MAKTETKKTGTASTHAGGKVALSFKANSTNGTPLKNNTKSTIVQDARRKQMAESVPKKDWVGSKTKHDPKLSQSTRITNMQTEAKKVLKKK